MTGRELLGTMNEVAGVAADTARVADAGRENLGEVGRTMAQLEQSSADFSQRLAAIRRRAEDINMVITTITKVADQTNLLSINAAIEAEKAGEYGTGFLVVAREIRRLADQTAVASLDIERMVKEMQYSVSAGVMEMGTVSAKLGEIIGAVHGIHGRFGQVTEGMRAQSQGAEQIREAMIRLAEGATRTASSLDDFNRATTHLRAAVGDLKEEVSRFTI